MTYFIALLTFRFHLLTRIIGIYKAALFLKDSGCVLKKINENISGRLNRTVLDNVIRKRYFEGNMLQKVKFSSLKNCCVKDNILNDLF